MDGGEDEGRETGRGRVWTGVRVEDGGGQDGAWTGVDGGKGGSMWADRGRARSMFQGSSQTCFIVAQEIEVEGVADGDDSGREGGSLVAEQRPCTKHVSGLVSNMLRCGLKY